MSRNHWCVIALFAIAGTANRAQAQGLGDRLKRSAAEAAARKVEQRVEKKAGEATDAALDGAEKGAKATVKGPTGGAASPKTASPTAAAGAAATATPRDSGTADAPPRTNTGRDFTPGTRVLFSTDFARDEVGDFPRALELREGNAEVAEVGTARYLRATSTGEFFVPLPETLPSMFTVEFDYGSSNSQKLELHFTDGDTEHYVVVYPWKGGIESESTRSMSEIAGLKEGAPFRVQVMADGDYAKVYMNGTRVANLPNARLGRSNRLRFKVGGFEDAPTLFGNVRVAAGGKDLYKELAGAGRVTADGILFDTNSDRIRPESDAVLREIGEMLTKHADLRLSIEGHTDDVGEAAANKALSQKRAEAVRSHLVTKYGVAADRLEAKGHGASQPVVPNDSDTARQRNRRVDLVKR